VRKERIRSRMGGSSFMGWGVAGMELLTAD
jgi:hypothetical protein